MSCCSLAGRPLKARQNPTTEIHTHTTVLWTPREPAWGGKISQEERRMILQRVRMDDEPPRNPLWTTSRGSSRRFLNGPHRLLTWTSLEIWGQRSEEWLTPAGRSWHTWGGPLCCSAGGTCSHRSDSEIPGTAAFCRSHRRPAWRRSSSPESQGQTAYQDTCGNSSAVKSLVSSYLQSCVWWAGHSLKLLHVTPLKWARKCLCPSQSASSLCNRKQTVRGCTSASAHSK